ncbi:MAG: hypothetical protein ACXVA9_12580 [Bdellovibrionales bacterium]
MRHNKIIGWESFLEVVERVQKVSPWLSRQIAKRASEWPFWPSGVQIKEWRDTQVWVQMPLSFRNSIEGEITQGHLVLAGELVMRLLLLRYRQEFPFRYRITSSQFQTHHAVDQAVDIKFSIGFEEWERIRLELARESRSLGEFAFSASLVDGRLAGSFTFQVAFELEKFLPA